MFPGDIDMHGEGPEPRRRDILDEAILHQTTKVMLPEWILLHELPNIDNLKSTETRGIEEATAAQMRNLIQAWKESANSHSSLIKGLEKRGYFEEVRPHVPKEWSDRAILENAFMEDEQEGIIAFTAFSAGKPSQQFVFDLGLREMHSRTTVPYNAFLLRTSEFYYGDNKPFELSVEYPPSISVVETVYFTKDTPLPIHPRERNKVDAISCIRNAGREPTFYRWGRIYLSNGSVLEGRRQDGQSYKRNIALLDTRGILLQEVAIEKVGNIFIEDTITAARVPPDQEASIQYIYEIARYRHKESGDRLAWQDILLGKRVNPVGEGEARTRRDGRVFTWYSGVDTGEKKVQVNFSPSGVGANLAPSVIIDGKQYGIEHLNVRPDMEKGHVHWTVRRQDAANVHIVLDAATFVILRVENLGPYAIH